ncbi:hypothetical protein NP233_g10810 [Leucocoprinus birnbaumii]|uniref:Uncharacterized protein n=1 Tax=Leucocoprinus birnbaumii TaxID=56174 RepID=A0AAD5VI08_9AGAR|nr:hypothetical protein NP233_g10810 [Leucocoprinus birnbaumii]
MLKNQVKAIELIFTPQLLDTAAVCSVHKTSVEDSESPVIPAINTPCPAAPKAVVLPLEDLDVTHEGIVPSSHELFPIAIDNITISQQVKLREIVLECPVHIHTPAAHIGFITTGHTGQRIHAFDAALTLKTLNWPIDIAEYSGLHLGPEKQMKNACRECHKRGGFYSEVVACNHYASRNSATSDLTLGRDSTLGNVDIWGLERISMGGYSVIHIA